MRSMLAGALASAFLTLLLAGTASAAVHIVNDPGGEISSYLLAFKKMRAAGERVVIDGPCLSACTLLTGIVPRHHSWKSRHIAVAVSQFIERRT